MRAYVRDSSSIDIEISGGLPRPPQGGGDPTWSQFCQVLEEAANHADRRLRPALTRLAHCGGLSVSRAFDCGREERALEAWCGHSHCPACAERAGGAAARFVLESWDERLITVEVTVAGGLESTELPSAGVVAEVRAAWAEATATLAEQTGLPRLEAIPRVLIAPQSITLFARAPYSGEAEQGEIATECLVEALREVCSTGGLAGAAVHETSRERAAQLVQQGLQEQARRFLRAVEREQERWASFAWRVGYPGDASRRAAERASAKRLIEELGAAHDDRRRQRLLGGKGCLPAPPRASHEAQAATCGAHGHQCHVILTRVREQGTGELVIAYPGDQTPEGAAPALASFFASAAREGVRRRAEAHVADAQLAIGRRMRRAG